MGQDVLTISTKFGISDEAQSALGPGGMKRLAADFFAAETTAFNVVLPNVEKLIRKGLIGGGGALWGRQALNGYLTHPSLTFADILSTDQFARLAARFMSGTVTTTLVATGVYDHVIELMPEDANPQLEASTLAFKAGGLDFVLADMVGNSLAVNYADGSAPTYSCEQVGSGYFEFMGDQTPALVLPDADPNGQNYIGNTGAHVTVTMNDGTNFNLSSLGLLAAYSLTASNNVATNDRRSGDSVRETGDLDSGAYSGKMTRGNDVQFSIGCTIFVDNGKRMFTNHLNNVEVTNTRFLNVGRLITGTYRHEVEFIVPRATIMSTQPQDRGGKLVMETTFEPLLADGEAGGWKLRIRNGSATLS